jgi:hypothetical protein
VSGDDRLSDLRREWARLRYAALRIDEMSPQSFEDQVLSRLDRIETRMGQLETKWSRLDGALTLMKIVGGILGFAGISAVVTIFFRGGV